MNGQFLAVDWLAAEEPDLNVEPVEEVEALSDDDYCVLNALEDLEAARINFGVFEAWTSVATLADGAAFSRDVATRALWRLSSLVGALVRGRPGPQ